ncbi:MAG: hypothetical protein FJZ95_08705 [Chloroflexi bacterium]|nr:hypothetical protein [Chloroflexota bacterium]
MAPTLQYFLLMLGSSLGVYQLGAAAGNFRGLWFFPRLGLTYLGGFAILGATYIWFFTCADLKMNANDGEVEGFEQLYLFLAGAALALVVTYLVSSVVNYRWVKADGDPVIGKGLEDLKWHTVFHAIAYRWRNRKRGK